MIVVVWLGTDILVWRDSLFSTLSVRSSFRQIDKIMWEWWALRQLSLQKIFFSDFRAAPSIERLLNFRAAPSIEKLLNLWGSALCRDTLEFLIFAVALPPQQVYSLIHFLTVETPEWIPQLNTSHFSTYKCSSAEHNAGPRKAKWFVILID